MRNRPRNTRGEVAQVRFVPLEQVQRPDRVLEMLVEQLFARVLGDRPAPSLIGLHLHPPTFENPFTIALRPPEQNNPAAIADYIQRLNDQSAAGIDLTAGTTLTKVLAVWPMHDDRTENGREGGCSWDNEHSVVHTVNSLVRTIVCANTKTPGLDNKCLRIMLINNDFMVLKLAICYAERELRRIKNMYTLDDVRKLQQWVDERYGEAQIRLTVFEKERQYRIVYKGASGRAARFNLCLLLENAHFHYVGRIEQLFRCTSYWVDCERRAQPSLVNNNNSPTGGTANISVHNANSFSQIWTVTTTICPIAHRPPWMGEAGVRSVQSANGDVFVEYVTTTAATANGIVVPPMWGPHAEDGPCFIQPMDGRRVFGQSRRQQQRQQQFPVENCLNRNDDADDNEDDTDDDNDAEGESQHGAGGGGHRRHASQKTIRYCFFDAETSQDRPLQLRTQIAQKHVPLLIIAEVICERCIADGITIYGGIGQKANGCVCGMPSGPRGRLWCSPPFCNAPNDDAEMPTNITYNPRRLFFHCFEDATKNPVDQFLDFLISTGPRKSHTICLSHNGGKYDMHLVLEALHHRNLPPKRICTTGLKIYSMSLKGNLQRQITFKDTLNFFFCELDALPRTFNLPNEIATAKPFFPYLFIRHQNLNVRLQGLPNVEFYQSDHMKTAKREQFLRWYADEGAVAKFQLREQLIIYCANDVAILRESVLKFRQLIMENTMGLDPFVIASTGAGLALATFRRCFLSRNKLINTPEGGYLRGRRASAESARYIRMYELMNPGVHVQSAQWTVGEAHVEDSGYRLDGLHVRLPPLRNIAIEYMGCFYHGCPKCFPNDRQQTLAGGRSAEELYERTQRRLWELEHTHGFELHVVWGCEFKKSLRANPVLRQMYNDAFVPRPLNPREDALRGGRTEPFTLQYICTDDEEIVLIDIVSLYPYVMKAFDFPVGNPRVLTREVLLQPPTFPLPWRNANCNTFRKLLFVCVLPPDPVLSPLRIPLLPYRTNDGRLTFLLCARCADNRQQRSCAHTDHLRSWNAAYTHVELNKALELGYAVTDLFEVWHYEEWDGEMFRGYMNTFVGMKVQASGWPTGYDSEECHDEYIDEFERAEGIRLEREKIANNSGLRMVAKLLANSLWGKFAQRVGRTEVRYASSPTEFHCLLDDPSIEVLDFHHVSPHLDRVVVKTKADFSKAPATNCLPIAIFVTSYARLHLYSYIEKVVQLGHKLLYCDTDSIYYVAKNGEQLVPEGEALGQMKRELPERRIFEFISGGPKNYGYRHCDRHTRAEEKAELKVRSFRLSYSTSQLLNFESMKDIVLEHYDHDGQIDDALYLADYDDTFVFSGSSRSIRVSFPQIGRNSSADLYTYQAHKDYRPHYVKGRIRPGMETLPFGFRNAPQQTRPGTEDDEEEEETNDDGDDDDDDEDDDDDDDDLSHNRLSNLPGCSHW
ncbi:hypothetical protein niasHT_002682 [Heterodera trifolii]|uniref:DNA-directed DNA polymerase n=1 Tax=Heterodera trifolii TaxID=157864 RepID=A0ABD2MDV9_9BILA